MIMETSVTDSSAAENQPPEAPLDLNAMAQESQILLGDMLRLLSFDAQLTAQVEKDIVRIRMQCEDAGRLIGRRGSTVNEIQFLLNRILQRRHKVVPRIFLDVDGPKEIQQPDAEPDPEIVTRIQAQADKVRRWGDPVEIGPIHAADRQVLVDFFAKDRELEIVSLEPDADPSKTQKLQLRLRN